jgi:hypothetical protein
MSDEDLKKLDNFLKKLNNFYMIHDKIEEETRKVLKKND